MRNTILLLGGLLLASPLFAQTPVNDDCSGALSLTVGDTVGRTGKFVGATTTAGLPEACTYGTQPDLWYKFVAANSTQVLLLAATSDDDYGGSIKVYSGTCGSLQAVSTNCSEHYISTIAGGRYRQRLTVSGLQAGSTYYVRLSDAYNYSSVTFRLTLRNEQAPAGSVSLLEPANQAVNVNFELPQTLRWTAATGASAYEVRLYSTNENRTYYTTDTALPVRVPAGTYFWNVRAVNAVDQSTGVSDTVTFSTCASVANPVTISNPGYNAFCEGRSVKYRASANVAGMQWFYNYQPIPGATADTLVVTQGGTYSLRILGNAGCYSDPSNYLGAYVLPLPYKPHVVAVGAGDICNGGNSVRLTASGLYNAQWFSVGGGTNAWVDTFSTWQAGSYFVQIHGTNGCNSNSDTFLVRSLYTPPTYAITATGNQLSVPAGYEYYQWYRDGVAINGATANTYTALDNGSYRVDVGNSAYCKMSSLNLAFAGTAVSNLQVEGVACSFYPNPLRSTLQVDVEGGARNSATLRLVDAQGRLLRTVALKAGHNTVPVGSLPAGLYHAVLCVGATERSVQLVKLP